MQPASFQGKINDVQKSIFSQAKVFGGCSIFLVMQSLKYNQVGDPSQLSTVNTHSLFRGNNKSLEEEEEKLENLKKIKNAKGDKQQNSIILDPNEEAIKDKKRLAEDGINLYEAFNCAFVLDKSFRAADDSPFREALEHIKFGKYYEKDFLLLDTRFKNRLSEVEQKYFEKCHSITATNEERGNTSIHDLIKSGIPFHYICHEKTKNGKGVQVLVTGNGIPIVLKRKVTQLGNLVNGSKGTIRGTLWNNDNQAEAIIVEFPGYSGQPFIKEHPKIVPILKPSAKKTKWDIVLDYETTIHLTQGKFKPGHKYQVVHTKKE